LRLKHENIVPLFGVAGGFGSLPALISPWLKNGALTGYLEREHEMLSYTRKFALVGLILHYIVFTANVALAHGRSSWASISYA
jgi:hypothetical protein